MFRRLACCALLALAAAPAAEAGGLPAGVTQASSGVLSQDASVRYAAIRDVAGTRIVVTRAVGGQLVGSLALEGNWGIPVVTMSGATDGVSRDGHTLVLGDATPRQGGLRLQSRFAILDARGPFLRRIVSLKGDFSFDALSPDGRTLYLIQHVSTNNLSQYVVRGYDLDADLLLPRRISDPRQRGWVMAGYAVSRVASADGRWAYTLYGNGGGYPFVHALDTMKRTAVCIGIPWIGSQDSLWRSRLHLVDGGRLLTVSGADPTGRRFAIDTRTLRLVHPKRSGFQWLLHAAGLAAGAVLIGGVAGYRSGWGSRRRARATEPASGPSAASAKPSRHELAFTIAANAIGTTANATPSTVCWKPSAAPERAAPAVSAAAVNASPFQLRPRTPAATIAGTSTGSGASTAAAAIASPTVSARPSTRSGLMRARTWSDQWPTAILATPPSTCVTASTAAAAPGARPRCSCRKSTTKPITAIWPVR